MIDGNTTDAPRTELALPGRVAPAAPNAALLPQNGEYSLIQLEALAGIALKQATRNLRLTADNT